MNIQQHNSQEDKPEPTVMRVIKQHNISRPETISNTPQHNAFDFSGENSLDQAQLNRTEKFKGNTFKQFSSTIKTPQD